MPTNDHLPPEPSRAKTLQEVLDSTLANQRMEGIILTDTEIEEVKRLLIKSLDTTSADNSDA